MKASFNGNIPEIPGIAVDNFEDTTKRAYFLSHCHADHITGLKVLHSSLLTKSVNIYMSEISAAIVETHIDNNLMKFIKPLTGKTTIILAADEENGHDEMYVEVTPIPAGHCFGSLMFLFDNMLKKVLYTGDFRINENSVSKLGQLHDVNNKPIKLDVLYVDTTFQDANHETFPKRSETIAYVVREIQKWIDRGDEYRVGLEPSARYGYEFVFNKIYEHMKMKVFVNDQNWDLYRKFLHKLPGVTNEQSTTKIHLCSKFKKHCSLCYEDTKHNYLYIMFSAMKWQNYNPEETSLTFESENKRSVCFATHCSRNELVHFVEYLNPIKVVGFRDPYRAPGKKSFNTAVKHKTPNKSVDDQNEKPKKVPKHVLREIFE